MSQASFTHRLILCLSLALLHHGIACAQPVAQFPPLAPSSAREAATNNSGDLLFGIGGGAIIPQSSKFGGAGLVGGLPFASSGRLSFTPGPAISMFGSYEIVPHISVEAQIGYIGVDADRFRGTATLQGGITVPGSFKVDGHVDTIAGFSNLVYAPFDQRARVVPYVGAGIGFASSWASLNSVSLLGSSLPLGVRSSATSFAVDALVAADVRVGDRGNIGLVYQFIRIDPSNLGTTSTFAAKTGALQAHIFGGLFEYRF